MSSGTEIHGFSPVGSQYGIFGPVPRYFPRNLQKPEKRPIFAMAKMSPREGSLFGVDVVRLAPNLHMYNSTHQDLTLHGECLSISDGKGWDQCPVGWVIGTPNFQHGITPYCLEYYRRFYEPRYRTMVPPLAVGDRQTFSVKS